MRNNKFTKTKEKKNSRSLFYFDQPKSVTGSLKCDFQFLAKKFPRYDKSRIFGIGM